MSMRAKDCGEAELMNFETVLSITVSVLLLIYLAYALLRAEKF